MRKPADEKAPGEPIGLSEEGRPLNAYRAGDSEAPLRVLIVAGQHGDEGIARAAIRDFLASFADSQHASAVHLVAIPDLNPDGAVRKLRANARGIDLNRDHQMLASVEVRHLHAFVREFQPHLLIDVHSYPSRRRALLERGLVHCHDVLLDLPTHPGLRRSAWEAGKSPFLQAVLADLQAVGFRGGRYVLTKASGRVRHSTPDIRDARNSLALRYGLPTLLIEGRKPVRADPQAERRRLKAAVAAAIHASIERLASYWAMAENPEGSTAVRSRFVRADTTYSMPFRQLETGEILVAEMPGIYCPHLKITCRVALPAAYAIPGSLVALREVLHRHGFEAATSDIYASATVEVSTVVAAKPSHRRNRTCSKLAIEKRSATRDLVGYAVYPVTPEVGHALAVHLELESKFGLHRYPELGLTPRENGEYPVLRIGEASDTIASHPVRIASHPT